VESRERSDSGRINERRIVKYLRMNELQLASKGFHFDIRHSSFFLTSKIVNRCLSRQKRSFRQDSLFDIQGGSSRIGMLTQPEALTESPPDPVAHSQTLGLKVYEFSNHLGNVLTTFSDRKIAIESISDIGYVDYYTSEILSSTDYYPFGFQMPGRVYEADGYRYGFNGKEQDPETYGTGNVYDYGFRIYNPRIGKFLSVDPLFSNYPMLTSYQFASNTPIVAIDVDGLEAFVIHKVEIIEDKAIITIINDGDVVDNFSCPFQVKLPDGTIYYDNDWGVEGINNYMKENNYNKRSGGYYFGDERKSANPPKRIEGSTKDYCLDVVFRVPVSTTELGYEVITTTKLGYTMSYGQLPYRIQSVADLTPELLNEELVRMGAIDQNGARLFNFNQLDVFVPKDQESNFLDIATKAGFKQSEINFVAPLSKQSSMEITPVRKDVQTKELEQTDP
jgi:RHS repeat-associated protein